MLEKRKRTAFQKFPHTHYFSTLTFLFFVVYIILGHVFYTYFNWCSLYIW